jgi:tripartite-type tricarboxylate transporter receptor subunit TctC
MSVTQKGTSTAEPGRSGLRWKFLCGAVIPSLLALGCGAGDSDSGEESGQGGTDAEAGGCPGAAELEGERLEIAVPFAAGGGFDSQARVVGDALDEHFGVTPVVVNETGAGGLVSLNQHATTNPEELRIQYVQTPSSLAAQVAGAEGANFSLEDWPWLAQVTRDPQLAVASVDSGFTSLEEAFGGDQPPRFGATGPGGIDYLHAQVLPAVFDSEAEVITGIASTDEAVLTLASGDIDAYVLSTRALLPAVEAGDAVPIAVIGEQQENAPDVPSLSDLVEAGTEEEQLVETYVGLVEIGRAFAAVPGASEETVETLGCMLETAINDETVVELFEQQGDFVDYASGDEMQESVVNAVNSLEESDELTQLLEQSFQ